MIARTSTFSYKGQAVDVKQVANDLSVNYVLEGSLRRSGDRVRITAQLIDHDGLHVWAEKYDRVVEDIFELQDEMTQTIAAALEPELNAVERDRATSKPPENLDAWESYQRGLWNLWHFDHKPVIVARDLFQQAIELDPGFATAYAYQSYCNYILVVLGYSEERDRLLEEGKQLAKKAMEIDPRDPVADLGQLDANLLLLQVGTTEDQIGYTHPPPTVGVKPDFTRSRDQEVTKAVLVKVAGRADVEEDGACRARSGGFQGTRGERPGSS